MNSVVSLEKCLDVHEKFAKKKAFETENTIFLTQPPLISDRMGPWAQLYLQIELHFSISTVFSKSLFSFYSKKKLSRAFCLCLCIVLGV